MLDASIERLDPKADVCPDDKLDLSLVGRKPAFFHQVIAHFSELKALPVVTEKRA